MTDAELRRIEDELGFKLPSFYRSTMLNYPFESDSGREPMLPDDPEELINLNAGGVEVEGVQCPFFVGRGSDETFFFVDASEPASAVYKSEGEACDHVMQAGSWGKYLTQIKQTRKLRKKSTAGASGRWWPF